MPKLNTKKMEKYQSVEQEIFLVGLTLIEVKYF
jgi:hypothetical protein